MIKKVICIVLLPLRMIALEIREPLASEIKDVAQLYYHAWHNTYDIMAPYLSSIRTPENCLKQWSEYYLRGNNHFILIALENKKITGVIFAGPIENKNPKACESYDSEIDKLYITPALKNKGIGSQLLKASFERLRLLGFKNTVVRCLTKNEDANNFYEKKGGVLIAQPKVDFNETMNIYGFKFD